MVKLAVRPANRAPIIDRGGFHRAQGRGDHLEVRVDFHSLFDHPAVAFDAEGFESCIIAGHLKAEAGGKILLVADHHVDIFCKLPVDLLRLCLPADLLPEGGTVVEIIGDDRAPFFRGLHGLQHRLRRCFRERGENAARVQPARAEAAEDEIPVDIAGF